MEKMVDGLPSDMVKFSNYQIKNQSEGGWTMKRIVWCAAVMMLLVCVGAWALAEEEIYSDGGYEYVLLEDGSAKITGYDKDSDLPKALSELEIPDELGGHPVTAVAGFAFQQFQKLTSVTIPDSVTEIEGNPFPGSYSLQTIEVSPDHPTLALIDGVLFDKTEKRLLCYPAALEAASYQIPQGITAIADGAFASCEKLERVSIPDGVTAIGDFAFAYCSSLSTVSAPVTITSIGDYAFTWCVSLQQASVPMGMTAISEGMFSGCESLENVMLPDSVTSIGESAFSYCTSLVAVLLPDGVTQIGESAFSECYNMVNVKIPQGVTSIAEGTFYACMELKHLSLPEGLTSIGDSAFEDCRSLEFVTLPDTIVSIGSKAFYQCESLSDIALPEGLTSIGDDAFRYCESLTEMTIPGSVSSIGELAFAHGSEDLVLTVERDSYARDYAQDNGIKYAYEDANDWLYE